MLLLSVLVLRVNRTILSSGTVVSSSKLGLTATSLAMSYMDEIKSKAFDEYTVGKAASDSTKFTSANNLGPETSETYSTKFDDIDDYNGFDTTIAVQVDTNFKPDTFEICCSVVYVSTSNPNIISGTQTWSKKISVYVTNDLMTDTVKVSNIFSYWAFR